MISYSVDEILSWDNTADRVLGAIDWAIANLKDDPKLPPRSADEKAEDALYGELGEILIEKIAPFLLKSKKKYQDHEGSGLLFSVKLHGVVEIKTIRAPSIATLATIVDKHRKHAGCADWLIAIHADRDKRLLTPYCAINMHADTPGKWKPVYFEKRS